MISIIITVCMQSFGTYTCVNQHIYKHGTCNAIHMYYAATERLCMVIPHTCLSEAVLDISSSLFSPAPGGGWQWWTKRRMMSTSGVAEMASSNDYSSKNYKQKTCQYTSYI